MQIMSKTIEIKDPSKLGDVLRIFSALDEARWSDARNYNLINYCEDDFTFDEKLLTHWFLRAPEQFIAELVDDFKRKPYKKRRLWCSIRDYLKSDEFNSYLVGALKDIDTHEAVRWSRKNVENAAFAMIELPGDVWNNDPIFRDGLFSSPYLGSTPPSWDMPRTIREIYNKMPDQNAAFYPEQLDVTFDFVPSMCSKLKCHRCLFGGGIDKLCHQQRGLYCPVTLAACGYFYQCDPDNCAFKSDSVRDFCQSSVAKREV
jgi:hypothetical protein